MAKQQKFLTLKALSLAVIIMAAMAAIGWSLMIGSLQWQPLVTLTISWWFALVVVVATLFGYRHIFAYFGRLRRHHKARQQGYASVQVIWLKRFLFVATLAAVLFGRAYVEILRGGTTSEYLASAGLTSLVIALWLVFTHHRASSKRTSNEPFVPLGSLMA